MEPEWSIYLLCLDEKSPSLNFSKEKKFIDTCIISFLLKYDNEKLSLFFTIFQWLSLYYLKSND
jgi:hypothetical protein